MILNRTRSPHHRVRRSSAALPRACPHFLKLTSASKIDRKVLSEYTSVALIKTDPTGTELYVREIITLDTVSTDMKEVSV